MSPNRLDGLLEMARGARLRAENARIQALEATQALGVLINQLDYLATKAQIEREMREQAKS